MEGGIKKARTDPSDRGRAMDTEDATTQVATMTTTTSIQIKAESTTSHRDMVLSLRPIVFGLQEKTDFKTLRDSLEKLEFLHIESISQDENEIMNAVFRIYREARSRDAETIPVHNENINSKYREAALEMRNAILFSELEGIGEGVEVYRGYVPSLELGGVLTRIIIRPEDKAFWDRCIDLCMEDNPVCGVGNPGIGKTTTSLYPLQQLVREKQIAVVYTNRRTNGSADVFYEFIPVLDGDSNKIENVDVKVYEIFSHQKGKVIPTMMNRDAVFLVDPGKYRSSCDDVEDCETKFIMNASNDEKHWGGNEFTKFRGSASSPAWEQDDRRPGIMVYGSPWTGRQLLLAKPYLGLLQQHSEDELLRRHRIVGGSIRDIIWFDEDEFTEKVETALQLDSVTVNALVAGRYQFTFQANAPSSVLVGIGPSDDRMNLHKTSLKSDYVEERLAVKHLQTSWYAVLDEQNSGNRGNLFEAFLRVKFSQGKIHFSTDEARQSMRQRPGKANEKKNYLPGEIMVGSRRSILRVPRMVERVRNDPTQSNLYYSKDEFEPLIDMIYRVDDGFEAIQSTVSKSHDAKPEKIRSLATKLRLGSNEKLRIFYAVPSPRFSEFVTNPVNPLLDQPDLANVSIFHLSISGDDD